MDLVDQRGEGEGLDVQDDAPDVHAREVQQGVDRLGEPLQVALHDDEALLLLVGDGAELALQDVVRVALDRGQGRAELVAHVGQEVGLHPVQLLELLVHGGQLLVRLLELVHVVLELLRHVVEALGQDLQLVVGADVEAPVEVALGDLLGPRRQLLERFGDARGQGHRHDQGDADGDEGQAARRPHEVLDVRIQPAVGDLVGEGKGRARVVLEVGSEDLQGLVAIRVAAVDHRVRAAGRRGQALRLQQDARRQRGGRAAHVLQLRGIEEHLPAVVDDEHLLHVAVHGQQLPDRVAELVEVGLVEAQVDGGDRRPGEAGERERVLLDALAQLLALGDDHVHAVEDEDGHDHGGKGQGRAGLEAAKPERHVRDPLRSRPRLELCSGDSRGGDSDDSPRLRGGQRRAQVPSRSSTSRPRATRMVGPT